MDKTGTDETTMYPKPPTTQNPPSSDLPINFLPHVPYFHNHLPPYKQNYLTSFNIPHDTLPKALRSHILPYHHIEEPLLFELIIVVGTNFGVHRRYSGNLEAQRTLGGEKLEGRKTLIEDDISWKI